MQQQGVGARGSFLLPRHVNTPVTVRTRHEAPQGSADSRYAEFKADGEVTPLFWFSREQSAKSQSTRHSGPAWEAVIDAEFHKISNKKIEGN